MMSRHWMDSISSKATLPALASMATTGRSGMARPTDWLVSDDK